MLPGAQDIINPHTSDEIREGPWSGLLAALSRVNPRRLRRLRWRVISDDPLHIRPDDPVIAILTRCTILSDIALDFPCFEQGETWHFLGSCHALRKIYLNGSGIREVPDSWRRLRFLRVLELPSCHEFEEVPPWISDYWKDLEVLNFFNRGGLKLLPRSLGSVEGLKRLNLDLCPALEEPPRGILGDDLDDREAVARAVIQHFQRIGLD